MAHNLDILFPLPHKLAVSSDLVPSNLPGVTASSTDAVLVTLKDNHQRYHCYFNDKGFHNHTVHHLLVLYSLGADATTIKSAYAHQQPIQRNAYASPTSIDEKNFNEHLGDENYYNAYLKFFTDVVLRDGISAATEKWILFNAVNVPSTDSSFSAHMLCRFMASIAHPLIHAGHGFEFGLPGIVAEGLAQTAVHLDDAAALFPPSLFETSSSAGIAVSRLSALLPSLSLTSGEPTNKAQSPKIHALEIIAELQKNPIPVAPDEENDLVHSPLLKLPESVKRVNELVERWVSGLSLEKPGGLDEALEELAWLSVIMYAIGGWNTSGPEGFKASFFIVHMVTSSIFVSSVAHSVSMESQKKLLAGYLAITIATYVVRGTASRPLPIKSFFAEPLASIHPSIAPVPHPRANALVVGDQGPNPWVTLLPVALKFPEEHVPKTIRALAHWARAFGSTPAGHWKQGDIGIDEIEHLDGTLFVRAALLTLRRTGRAKESEEESEWDYHM